MRTLIAVALGLAAGTVDAAAPSDGRRVFDRTCSACHANTLSEAPQLKHPEAWAPRLAKGRETLYKSALEGFVGPTGEEMPPRGGNSDLSDAEVKAAVDFIFTTVSTKRNTP